MSKPTTDTVGLTLIQSVRFPYGTQPLGIPDVWVAAWAPDSKQIAIVAPERQEVIFYDLARRVILHDRGFAWSAGVNSGVRIAWSPDGRYLALASWTDKKVDLYEIATRRILSRFATKTQITGVQFSSDSKQLWIGLEFAAPALPQERFILAQALDVPTMRPSAQAIAPIPVPALRTISAAASFQRLSGKTLLFSQIHSLADQKAPDGSWNTRGGRSHVSIFDIEQGKPFAQPLALVPDEGDTVVRPPRTMLMHPSLGHLVILKKQGSRQAPHQNIPPEADKPLEIYDLRTGRRSATFGDLVSLGGVYTTSIEYSVSGENLFVTCGATRMRPAPGASTDTRLNGIYVFDGLQGILRGSVKPTPATRQYLSPDGRYLAALDTEILHILAV